MKRLAWLLVLLSGCGDGTSPVDVPPGSVRIDPDAALSFDHIGERATLTARTADGREVRWSSSAPGVASVTSGDVTAVGNGEGWIIARAAEAADSVRVTVQQEMTGVAFLTPPGDVQRDHAFFQDIRLAAVDAGGFPVRSFSGNLVITLEAGANPGTLRGTTTRSAEQGVASFDDLTIDASGSGYRLEGTAAGTGFRVESGGFDVVDGADVIVGRNRAGSAVGVLIDGASGGLPFDDRGRVVSDSVVELVASAGSNNEVIAFTRGRPPIVVPASWTSGPDTVAFAFPDALAIPITIWVVKGPYADQHARASAAVATTSLIWDEERMGLDFSDVEFVDATADPDASRFFDLTLCNQQSQIVSSIGKRNGRINIYYVGTVDGGTDRGRACPGADFIMMAERSGHELLAHEIGHQFGLGHIDADDRFDRTNIMHSASNTRRYMTEGQVFRSNYNDYSALRSVYGLRSDPSRSCADFETNERCPSLARRLFGDGGFPADAEAATLAEWLLTTCIAGEPAARPVSTTEALLDAIGAGPPAAVIAAARRAEAGRAEVLRMRIAEGATFGLPPAAVGALRARLDIIADERAAELEAAWREAAVVELGRLNDEAAAAALRAFSTGPDRRLAAAARRALRGVRR